MAFSPSLFFSNIRKHDGPARPCRFMVVLPIPPYIGNFVSMTLLQQILDLGGTIQDLTTNFINGLFGDENSQSQTSDPAITRYLSMQCDTAELPGVSLQTADAKIYGPTYKIPYQKQYNDTTLSFIATNDFYERKLFDRWIEAIMPPDTNNLRFPKSQNSRYLTDITIIQFDEFIKQIYAVKLIDAFPVSVSSMPLSWGDDGIHRVSVNFAYQRYRTIYDGKYDIGQAIGAGLGVVFNYFIGELSQEIFGSD